MFQGCEKSVSNTRSVDDLEVTVLGKVEFGIATTANANTSTRSGHARRSATVTQTLIDDAYSVLISIEKSDATPLYSIEGLLQFKSIR